MDKKVERIINLYNRLYDGEVLVKSEGNYSAPHSEERLRSERWGC